MFSNPNKTSPKPSTKLDSARYINHNGTTYVNIDNQLILHL
jgi:hypothetical protein